MALIGTIRKQSGLLIIIIGVALAAFVLGDFLKPRSGRKVVNIAEVLGEDITYNQFDTRYQQNLDAQKRNQKKENLSSDDLFRIRQQTYDQMVQEIVMDNQYNKLGLVVSADELFDQLQGEDPHPYILQYFKDPNTQKYDPELVRNYIKQLDQMDQTSRDQWNLFVQAIKEDRIRTKYKDLISKAYFMPDKFLTMDFDDRKTDAEVRLTGARYSSIPDSAVTVTDKDFEKYYEEYKYNYKQDASRDIDYVIFDVKPSPKDRSNIQKQVFEVFSDFKKADNIPLFVNGESDTRYDSTFKKTGELPVRIDSIMFHSPVGTFVDPYIDNNAWHMAKLVDVQMRPDSMKATHVLIAYKGARGAGEDVKRSKEDAKILADSLLTVLKQNPNTIEDIAKKMSDDPSAEKNSGDLGWFADGSMVYPFNQAVLTHNIGDITMAESPFGFHIIKVTGKKDLEKKVRVAMIDIGINPSQETFQDVFAIASEFQGKAVNQEAFDTVATKMGVVKRSAPNLQQMSDRIAGLDNPRQIVQWVFNDDTKVGTVSHVFTLEDKYVVAILTKIKEKGIPELDEIKDNLKPLVAKELKGDMMVQKLKDAVKATPDLYRVAVQFESKVDTVKNLNFDTRNISGYGNEPNVIAKAFTLPLHQLSDPIKGNNAAFLIIVDNVIKPDTTENKKMFERQLLMNFQSKVSNNGFMSVLEDNADIVDNRVSFY